MDCFDVHWLTNCFWSSLHTSLLINFLFLRLCFHSVCCLGISRYHPCFPPASLHIEYSPLVLCVPLENNVPMVAMASVVMQSCPTQASNTGLCRVVARLELSGHVLTEFQLSGQNCFIFLGLCSLNASHIFYYILCILLSCVWMLQPHRQEKSCESYPTKGWGTNSVGKAHIVAASHLVTCAVELHHRKISPMYVKCITMMRKAFLISKNPAPLRRHVFFSSLML